MMDPSRLARLGDAFEAKQRLLERRLVSLQQERRAAIHEIDATERALDSPLVQSLAILRPAMKRIAAIRGHVTLLQGSIDIVTQQIAAAHGLRKRLSARVGDLSAVSQRTLLTEEIYECVSRDPSASPPQGWND